MAAGLIYEGFVMEGLAIAKGVRDRHDGQRRNPWNETECGSHYARALSSWSLLTALSGYHYSAPEGRLTFAPRVYGSNFRCLFTAGTGWGSFACRTAPAGATATLSLVHGSLALAEFGFPARGAATAALGSRHVGVQRAGTSDVLRFDQPVTLAPGDVLTVRVATGGRASARTRAATEP